MSTSLQNTYKLYIYILVLVVALNVSVFGVALHLTPVDKVAIIYSLPKKERLYFDVILRIISYSHLYTPMPVC